MPIIASPSNSLDIITVTEAAAAINQQSGPSVVSLQGEAVALLVTAVSARIDALAGPVVQRTVAGELHNGSDWAHGNVYESISLRQVPVFSVLTVAEYSGAVATTLTAESNTSKPASSYSVDLATGKLYRRQSGSPACFPAGRQNIEVTYVAGRYGTTANVSSQFKQAASTLFAHWWRAEHGVGSRFGDIEPTGGITATGIPSFGMPRAVVDLLIDELRTPFVI
jgi:hypothetical protein